MLKNNLASAIRDQADESIADDGRWFSGVPGTVVDNQDPERQHRVKCVILLLNPDEVYDVWCRQFVFCLGNGFGSAFIPPVGTEVVLFGQLAQKHNLFYATLYNEEMLVPEGFDDEQTVGVHAPGNLKFIAELIARLQGQNVQVVAEQLAHIEGENFEAIATALAKVQGDDATVLADDLAKLQGNNATVEADQAAAVMGQTVTIHADGSMTIQANGNIAVSATGVLTLQGRTVNKFGLPI